MSHRFTPLDAGHEALQNLVNILSPDPAWPTAKCGECGYYFERHIVVELDGGTPYDEIVDFGCRTGPGSKVQPDTNACPSFVARPGEVE